MMVQSSFPAYQVRRDEICFSLIDINMPTRGLLAAKTCTCFVLMVGTFE